MHTQEEDVQIPRHRWIKQIRNFIGYNNASH